MSILKIYKYPHPILREMCQPVTTFDDELARFVKQMIDTMYHGQGAVGLAANQVGDTRRIVVMDMTAKTTRTDLKVLINPVIVQASRNKTMREGCLSFPDYLANIKRATRLTVEADNVHGQKQTFEVHKMEAVCVQHEIDHLDGILMIDRINSLNTDWIRRQPAPELDSGSH